MIDLKNVEVDIQGYDRSINYLDSPEVLITCLNLSFRIKQSNVNSVNFISSTSDEIENLKKIKRGDKIILSKGPHQIHHTGCSILITDTVEVIFPFKYDFSIHSEVDKEKIEKEIYYVMGIDCSFYAKLVVDGSLLCLCRRFT